MELDQVRRVADKDSQKGVDEWTSMMKGRNLSYEINEVLYDKTETERRFQLHRRQSQGIYDEKLEYISTEMKCLMLKVHTLMGLVDDEDSQEAGNILRTIRGVENAMPGHETTIAEHQTILSGRLDQMMGGAPAMTTAGHDERMEKQKEYSMNQVWKKLFFKKTRH